MTIRCLPFIALSFGAILATGCASSSSNREPAPGMSFNSPDEAVSSLVAALRDKDVPRLKKIFGSAGDQIISSGDPVADKAQAEKFLALYDERHRLEANEDDGTTTLFVGADDWPFPVPIIPDENGAGGYVFDAAAGEDEILNRRIGRNELAVEQICLAIVDAQQEYAEARPMGGELRVYAQKLISDRGMKNGLYWETAEGESPSPLGPLVAEASQEGYGPKSRNKKKADAPAPYHGYYFRLLTSQGPHASGGEMDYLVNGKLVGGFGVIAYPAIYGNSGVMTFMTNHDGVVYEKDLGPDTAKLAQAVKSFDPGPGWQKTMAPPDDATPPAQSESKQAASLPGER